MDKFYFYSSYARPICKLNHNEAGQVIKAMCAFIFHDKEPSEKTLPKAKALFYLLDRKAVFNCKPFTRFIQPTSPRQARTQLMRTANKCSELHLCRQRRA